MFFQRNSKIDITYYDIVGDVSNEIKLVYISDLHEYKVEPIIEIIKDINPEIILLGGDILHNLQHYERGIELFKVTASLCPTLCCLGNHERLFKEDIIPLITKTGVIPLDNASIQYKDINVGGLSSPTRKVNIDKEQIIEDVPEEINPDTLWLKEYSNLIGYKLLLCHQPEFYDKYIRDSSINLILSGHAHGGQWRIKNQGIFAPGQGFFPKYTNGIHENRLIISRGIGNAYLIPRINNNPEIVAITLYPKKKHSL